MAQESWKRDGDETGCQPPEGPVLCANKCGFFGSSATMNFCSKCYRDLVLKQGKASKASVAAVALPKIEQSTEKESQVLPILATTEQGEVGASSSGGEEKKTLANRCCSCKKRVGLTGFKCRCGDTFCALHRYSDKHNCPFDYRKAGQEAIAKDNPVVKAEKIGKI
uniref:TSA: Wollemia nobilis Ref_Wollemi_Transcript_11586_1514 transcribed RNA sequence n=1 Tax=Wollemia nobilis TaxID=56998 RepID=A0A0C9S8C8_9CONI